MLALLRTFSLQELLHHPWRNAAAVVAVMLGVALAFSVHLINASALDEFSSAVRSINGQPDLELRSSMGPLNENLYAQVAAHPGVAIASPTLQFSTTAVSDRGDRVTLRVVAIDALVAGRLSPALLPQLFTDGDPGRMFAPAQVFLNPSAMLALGLSQAPHARQRLQLQSGLKLEEAWVAGTVGAGGGPLAMMDLGAAQDLFGKVGELTRLDIQLNPGSNATDVLAALDLGPKVIAVRPGDDASRINRLSGAYRLNLTVLALVALFTGAFLVFSVLSLSVSKRSQQFALLGVLGWRGRERLQLVLWESTALGLLGSALGIGVGTGMAALALNLLGGDLGGGYFVGVAPPLKFDVWVAVAYAGLGVLAALAGAWWPARAAQKLPLAQTLKGLNASPAPRPWPWPSVLLVATALALAAAPPVGGLPLAAYASVALLLVGGISGLPSLVGLLYDRLAPWFQHRLLPLLAIERARRVRESAAVAISGVVASLSLAVALTVMVASFRLSVTQWLDVVLPADFFIRSASQSSAADTVFFSPAAIRSLRQLPGIARLGVSRQRELWLAPDRPPVTLVARDLTDPARTLPLVQGPVQPAPGDTAIYVSEAMVDLYGAKLGSELPGLGRAMATGQPDRASRLVVAGVWRDYAHQFGTIALDLGEHERLTGDRRVNDLAVWLQAGVQADAVQQAMREVVEHEHPGVGSTLEFASSAQIRANTLRIFDRSFAVTYWLQGVAMAIGLFGVAASFSAQVLARRKEFGLLLHLGLTRKQVLAVVAGEGCAWTTVGAVAGLAMGLAVSVVLVRVVNPQSFHWSMDLTLPWPRLMAMCAILILSGSVTAWLAGRAAAGRDAIMAVKEDW